MIDIITHIITSELLWPWWFRNKNGWLLAEGLTFNSAVIQCRFFIHSLLSVLYERGETF
jgi:hypothetical protein